MPGGGLKPGERRGGRLAIKLVALAHAIEATVAESRGLPGTSARERFKELVLNALASETLALKEIAAPTTLV